MTDEYARMPSVRLHQDELESLKAKAASLGMTFSEFTRAALEVARRRPTAVRNLHQKMIDNDMRRWPE